MSTRLLAPLCIGACVLATSSARAEEPRVEPPAATPTETEMNDALVELERSRASARRQEPDAPAPYREPGVVFVREPGETYWNSPGLAIAGTAVAGVGVVALVTGGALFGAYCPDAGGEEYPSSDGEYECHAGFATVLAGGTLVLTGLPMLVVGAWQVTPDDPRTAPTAEVRVGPATADIVGTF